MSALDTLKTPAADMTLQQHAAINLMIPVSGDDELDRMIWEAKRDQIATQVIAGIVETSILTAYDDIVTAAYILADAQLAASGWDQGEPA